MQCSPLGQDGPQRPSPAWAQCVSSNVSHVQGGLPGSAFPRDTPRPWQAGEAVVRAELVFVFSASAALAAGTM